MAMKLNFDLLIKLQTALRFSLAPLCLRCSVSGFSHHGGSGLRLALLHVDRRRCVHVLLAVSRHRVFRSDPSRGAPPGRRPWEDPLLSCRGDCIRRPLWLRDPLPTWILPRLRALSRLLSVLRRRRQSVVAIWTVEGRCPSTAPAEVRRLR